MIALLAQAGTPAPQALQLPEVEYSRILPLLILAGGALVMLTVFSLVGKRAWGGTAAVCTLATAVASAGAAAWLWNDIEKNGASRSIADAIAVDRFSVFFMLLIAAAIGLGALIADGYLRREGIESFEFYVLMLLSGTGAVVMASANDLIVLFLGLEILSMPLFVLAAFHPRRPEGREAAMKYFVLSAFASALFLYGVALVYGATGSTNMAAIATYLATNIPRSTGVLMAGVGLLVVGLGFKVAAVPFHNWTPDVYQGAPSPVTGFMGAAAKAAGFAALLRVLMSTFRTLQLDWRPLVWALAVVTMVVGSALAIVQTDVKRMLAYSSISHAGFILVGLEAGTDEGVAGSLFYLLAYTFMVLGSFAVVTIVGRKGDNAHDLEQYRGLGRRRPGLALVFTIFLMAQLGFPATSGLLAKFYVIAAAVERESYAIAVIAMVASVIAAFFYLRVVVTMYAGVNADGGDEPEVDRSGPRLRAPFSTGVALAVAVAFTILVGIVPSPVIDFARDATLLF